MKEAKIGEKMYVPTSLYISHGEDDVAGGLATISKVNHLENCKSEINRTFVEFKEIRGHSYNYSILMEKQKELEKKYKNKTAHNDPDYTDYDENF